MELLLVDLVLVTACLTTASAVKECYRRDPNNYCQCTILSSKTNANITINLDHIGLSYPASFTTSDDKYTYEYTPCKGQLCPNTPQPNSAMCQHVIEQKYWVSTGRFSGLKWEIINDDPANLSFTITYTGGDENDKKNARKSIVDFSTTTTPTVFAFAKDSSPTYRFTVKGNGIKPYTPSSGGGAKDISGPIGLTIICLAIAGLVAYCIVGGIFMYKVKGARGSEVIPNVGFWKGLPGLIKDGFLFTISPCYKRGSDYQSL